MKIYGIVEVKSNVASFPSVVAEENGCFSLRTAGISLSDGRWMMTGQVMNLYGTTTLCVSSATLSTLPCAFARVYSKIRGGEPEALPGFRFVGGDDEVEGVLVAVVGKEITIQRDVVFSGQCDAPFTPPIPAKRGRKPNKAKESAKQPTLPSQPVKTPESAIVTAPVVNSHPVLPKDDVSVVSQKAPSQVLTPSSDVSEDIVFNGANIQSGFALETNQPLQPLLEVPKTAPVAADPADPFAAATKANDNVRRTRVRRNQPGDAATGSGGDQGGSSSEGQAGEEETIKGSSLSKAEIQAAY